MGSTMSVHIEILGIYDEYQPRELFIQHIPEMKYLRVKGTITLKGIKEAMETSWANDEDLLAEGLSFIEFQLEDGEATLDSVVYATDNPEEYSVLHFSVHRN